MARYVFQVDALPDDVFAILVTFLSTFDLLSLSHVNSALLSELLARNSDIWLSRLRLQGLHALTTAKKHFYTQRTFQFPGILSASRVRGSRDRGGVIALPNTLHRAFIETSFSVSLWFALPPSTDESRSVYTGGVLLGALSRPWSDENWAFYHQQYIHVSEKRDLYCSMTDEKEIMAHDLKPGQWYHVALTFRRQNAHERSGIQSVYIDGVLVHTSIGDLHREWRNVPHMQLGSGCMSGGSKGAPHGQSCWYGFRGLIDDCGFWYHALSPEQIERLAQGSSPEDKGESKCVWCLQPAKVMVPFFGNVKKVRCLPPAETRHVEIARPPELRGLRKFRQIFSRR